jgi:nitrite reductase (NADH) large subunit
VSEPLVIVGNGMAATRLVDELTKLALGRYAIAVIGDEPRLAYNRVLLSSVLAGETASHDIELRPSTWWRDRGVTLKYGCAATEIDVGRREIKIEHEKSIRFSKLILTTGSSALRLNVPGADLAGVHTFRDSRDVDLLLALAAQKKRVVVVGGGLLGLEAAYGLAKAGATVTLVHLMDRLMERQLDAPAAELLKSLVERKGIEILLQANTARFHGETRVEGVEFPSTGASSLMTICKPARRTSLRSGNAPNIAASAMAWSSRRTSRRVCWRGTSPATSPFMPAGGRDQSEGLRRQRVLGGRFQRRRR